MELVSDEELEKGLIAAGNSLLRPPSSVKELIHLLDQIEQLLSKVCQSPSTAILAALSPVSKALAAKELLKHSDADVKVGVGCCFSELIRITAPEAPEDDETMKDVFELIVSCFENLWDVSSRWYGKRGSMLESMANVRSFLIMLDIHCETMIVEMFKHFLKVDRHYDERMFESMEIVMTLVLEEIDDSSKDVLNPILATLKRENEAHHFMTTISSTLAERVIQNSVEKITPYLAKAVKSLDASFYDFGEVVASVCAQEDPGSVTDEDTPIL
ncbi:hypothetical protein ABFS82_12G002300 [Erythranthe guttata]|nr:PREDICTED: sister chromatid cohesion protein PDS5-like [Erythranthe guttata]|eukprot:XP_012853319.1 PREDICTED: sister chromatid cohesion protein PDS5-like [Erythranthe guttata]